ncbi:BspA family leucine-rich repeat surface protein [Lentilactobacillus hilgardii]|nr:BspA family leucine-rich repeat surface protein [Lentilactobacillus hilgardii]MCV3739958.1 BspA family leucine-rich repeat surface protein [Lentilactobacillus hilgardii]
MNKKQNYLCIFVSALTIGASGYLYSNDVLAETDNPAAQVANTNSQIDKIANAGKVAFDTPNAQSSAKDQVQQMANSDVLNPQAASSGQIENVFYSIDNGVLTLSGGALKSKYGYPWGFNDTITDVRITGPLQLEGAAASHLFSNMSNLKSITGMDNLDTSRVTDMSYMFLGDSKLTTLDVSKFDTSKVTDMSYMFADNRSLTDLDVSNFNTSNVLDMQNMFQDASSLTSLNVSNFNTSNTTDMRMMFFGTSKVTSLDVSKFDTRKSTDMSYMFYDNPSLTTLDVSKFDTAKVKNMRAMFYHDSGLKSIDVSKFDTANVELMGYMFGLNFNLTSLDVSNFNTAKVMDMNNMFADDNGLTNLDVSNFNTANVNDMNNMFAGVSSLTSLDVSKFNTANVTNMNSMFASASNLTNLDLSNFDTAKVKNTKNMFAGDEKLWTLKFGPKAFNGGFNGTALPDHSSISEIPNSNPIRYASGPGWQAVAGGTVDSPKGPVYDGLLTNRPAETETYVWEQKPAADQYTLEVNKTQELLEGQSWDPTSAIVYATKNGESNKSSVTITDQDGKPVTQETVAALKSGSYPLTYKNGDQTRALNLTITATADTASLKTTDIDLYLNKSFTDADLRQKIEAKDSDGSSLNYQYNINDVTGKPVAVNDVSAKVGQYTVEITTDKPKNGKDPLKGTLTIRVTDGRTLNLKYTTKIITTNQAWQPEDGFDNATDAGGKTLTFKDITVNATDSSGKPVNDLNNLYKNPGTYTVRYTNGSVTKELKLTVQTPSNPTIPTTPLNPSTPTPSTSSNGSSTSSNTSTPSYSSGSSNNMNLPRYAATEGTVVYSIKKIGLYKTSDFTKNNRRSWYAKKPRINRPMFVVTGYARSANGNLRYQVRDVNHKSKTKGQKGYITASRAFVRPVYYATKHATITVINPRGVNAYRKANLTGKVKNYRQGTVLRVKGMVKHNLTTRYVLTNGKYVTANRKLVNMGRHKQVKSVKTKRSINRYSNVNFTKKNQPIAKKHTLKVYGYDYSHGNDVTKHGTLRYRVAGGYITANTKYVRTYK